MSIHNPNTYRVITDAVIDARSKGYTKPGDVALFVQLALEAAGLRVVRMSDREKEAAAARRAEVARA